MKLLYTMPHSPKYIFGPDDYPMDKDERSKGLFNPVEFKCFMNEAGTEAYGGFKFTTLPGNCGVVVSTETYIAMSWRGHGSAARLHEAKEHIARDLGYSMMLSTTIATNIPQVVSASKAKWKFIKTFLNKRTGNTCFLGVKELK